MRDMAQGIFGKVVVIVLIPTESMMNHVFQEVIVAMNNVILSDNDNGIEY